MKNVAYDIDDIVLYRGQSELPGVNNCSQVRLFTNYILNIE